MIVLGENEEYNPKKDHFYIFSVKKRDQKTGQNRDLNGWDKPPIQHTYVGETHRIRLMHIAHVGNITIRMLNDNLPIPIKYIAKDGADLPIHQQIEYEVSLRYGVGETADFAFNATEPGLYELHIRHPNPKNRWIQKWEVKPKQLLTSLPN